MVSLIPIVSTTSVDNVNSHGRSKRNRGPMSEETFHLLTEAVRGNPENRMDVNQFAKENMSFIFENSCKTGRNLHSMKVNQHSTEFKGDR